MHNCSARPCWAGFYSPDAQYGFVGTGRVDGNWSNRGSFFSSVREATICWSLTLNPIMFCSWRMAPQTQWNFPIAPESGVWDLNLNNPLEITSHSL